MGMASVIWPIPISPALPLAQLHRNLLASHCSFHRPTQFLSQSLCTCCSICLNALSSDLPMAGRLFLPMSASQRGLSLINLSHPFLLPPCSLSHHLGLFNVTWVYLLLLKKRLLTYLLSFSFIGMWANERKTVALFTAISPGRGKQ